MLDLRKTLSTKDQSFPEATYKQDNDLVEEITLAGNFGFEKKMSDEHYLKFNIEIQHTRTYKFLGNFAYKFIF